MRFSSWLLPIALLAVAGCGDGTSPLIDDLDGRWGWIYNGNPGGSGITLTLQTIGPAVSGSGVVCGNGPACNPGAVSVTGQHTAGFFGSFSLVLSSGLQSIAYKGQFHGPDTLVGTWQEGQGSSTVTLSRCTDHSVC